MKAVFHIDEESKWSLVLGNVKNMRKEIERQKDTCEIAVIANSEAVLSYQKDSSHKQQIQELIGKEVQFCACQNALNSYSLTGQDLFEGIRIVPAGVVEIVKKQMDGYAYLKP